MDAGSIAAAFIAQQAGQVQMAVAAKMLRMNAQSASNVAKLLEAASAELRPACQRGLRRRRQSRRLGLIPSDPTS